MERVRVILTEVLIAEDIETESILVFREKTGTREIRMAVGYYAASAIGYAAREAPRKAAFTHDTMAELIRLFGGTIEEVSIAGLTKDNFFVTVTTTNRGRLDMRPSDAIYLAIAFGAPIFASIAVLNAAEAAEAADRDSSPKPPEPHSELERLQQKMSEAIEAQNYEEAARLRDAIKRFT